MQQINQSSRNIYTPYVPIWSQSPGPLPWRVMQAVEAIFLNLTIALSNGAHYFFEAFARNDNPPAYTPYTPPLPDYMMDDNLPTDTPPLPDYMMDDNLPADTPPLPDYMMDDNPPAYTPPLPDNVMDDHPPVYTPPLPDYEMDEAEEDC